jgi:hypothetical protein
MSILLPTCGFIIDFGAKRIIRRSDIADIGQREKNGC